MVATVFDTLAYSKKLQAAGVPESAAEVHAIALAEIIDARLVTTDAMRETINDLKIELKQEISELSVETKREMTDLGYQLDKVTYQLTIRLGSMLAGGIFLLATLHKLLG